MYVCLTIHITASYIKLKYDRKLDSILSYIILKESKKKKNKG
jgi:hypothetical protein